MCRPVLISNKLSYGNSEGTNRSQNAQRECSCFNEVTVTLLRVTGTHFKVTVTLLRVTGTHFMTVTALKQRRFDILRISGAGRLYNLHPQDSTVTTVTRYDKYAA